MFKRLFEKFMNIPVVKKIMAIPFVQKCLNRETVMYVIMGVLTTAVDYIVFAIVNELMKRGGTDVTASSQTATVIAWIAAVTFAYFTNKRYVFQSSDYSAKNLIREALQFFGARLLSGVITLIAMRILVGIGMNEYLAKVLTSVFNLVFNYVASKLLIFKKK